MSAVLPSIAAMPYAVTSLRPLMRRCAPGSMRLSQRGAAARNQANDRRARAGSALESGSFCTCFIAEFAGGRLRLYRTNRAQCFCRCPGLSVPFYGRRFPLAAAYVLVTKATPLERD